MTTSGQTFLHVFTSELEVLGGLAAAQAKREHQLRRRHVIRDADYNGVDRSLSLDLDPVPRASGSIRLYRRRIPKSLLPGLSSP